MERILVHGMIRVSAGWALFVITLPLSGRWGLPFQAGWMLLALIVPYFILTEAVFDRIILQCAKEDIRRMWKEVKGKITTLSKADSDVLIEVAQKGKNATDSLLPCAAMLFSIIRKHGGGIPEDVKQAAMDSLNKSKAASREWLEVSDKSHLFETSDTVKAMISKYKEKSDDLTGKW